MEYIGRTLHKNFQGFGNFTGTVQSYDPSSGFFKIVYEDGDSEELELREVVSLFETMMPMPRKPGRPRKKRRREGGGGKYHYDGVVDCDNLVDVNVCDDVNGVFDGNLEKRKGFGEGLGEGNFSDGNNVNSRKGGINLNLNVPVEEHLDENLGDGVVGMPVCNGNLVRLDLNGNSGLDLNEVVHVDNDGRGYGLGVDTRENEVKRSGIDLNLDAPSDMEENLGVGGFRKELFFDLNTVVDIEVKEGVEDDEDKIFQDVHEKALFGVCNGIMQNVDGDVNQQTSILAVSSFAEHSCEATPFGLHEDPDRGIVADVHHGVLAGSNDFKVPPSLKGSACEDSDNPKNDNQDAMASPCKSVSRRGRKRNDRNLTSSMTVSAGFSSNSSLLPQKGGASHSADAPDYGDQDNMTPSVKQPSRRGRKRKVESFPSPETVLRRSTRRGSLRNGEISVTSDMATDLASSPAVSATTEEMHEEPAVLPQKLQLPPPSQTINLDGLCVLDVFSVYACLKSFSALLFLSPFQLEDFVTALKSLSPNSLLDWIHVSLLQILRKHLEHLSGEGCTSASNCLRSLNWDLLDPVTWPNFLAEYLLLHGSGLQPGFELNRLELFKHDYYKQSSSVKVELLRCLCDEVIEAEVIRSELNRRSLGTEADHDYDWITDVAKKRMIPVDIPGGAPLTGEVTDGALDWNSDECCLCKMDGNLICCDGCPAAFHSRCVGVAAELLPEGEWYCPECSISKNKYKMKPRRSLRGAELLGIDPHERFYYSCCDYLLVSDSNESRVLYHYYRKDELDLVIEVLNSSQSLYSGILKAIYKEWDVSPSGLCRYNLLEGIVTGHNAVYPIPQVFEPCSVACGGMPQVGDVKIMERGPFIASQDILGSEGLNSGKDSATVTETPYISSEGSIETTLTSSDLQKQGPRRTTRNSQRKSQVSEKLPQKGDCNLSSISSEVKESNLAAAAPSLASSGSKFSKGAALNELCEGGYTNCYCFGQTAASVAVDLLYKPPTKIEEHSLRTDDDTISAQLKIISKKCSKFYWPTIGSRDAIKETCGWCFACRTNTDEVDCLVNVYMGPVWEGSEAEMAIIKSERNKKGHLIDVICYMLSMEDRLRGLLLGPWLNPQYTKVWRESVLKASDLASLKPLLLQLESNLHHRAISEEWLKYEDVSINLGSSSHIVTTPVSASSKLGGSRKKARVFDESKPSANAPRGLGIYWWRGGSLSRQLFSWKVLPRTLLSKAARQGGGMKILGVLYPDGSDFARREKRVAWQAGVELSTTSEQLALQIRELGSNIKWDNIENTNYLCRLDKELRKSLRAFKKVIVRRKCLEGNVSKYLLDFGKRRIIPETVSKNGTLVEDASSERKRYWLDQSFLPLHLLKNFEEKRIARSSIKVSTNGNSKIHSGKKLPRKKSSKEVYEHDTRITKLSRKRGLSYLFLKAERAEYSECGHCKKNVMIREAVGCQSCQGWFHKRHVRKLDGAIAAECLYTCHHCYAEAPVRKTKRLVKINKSKENMKIKGVKASVRRRKRVKSMRVQPQGSKKATVRHSIKKTCKGRKAVSSKKLASLVNGRETFEGVPLRRSARQAIKYLQQQNKNNMQHRKEKHKKCKKSKGKSVESNKKVTSLQKKRTKAYYNYWLNGLHLSSRPDDERVVKFREKDLISLMERSSVDPEEMKCHLCGEAGSPSHWNYIACEICGEWYHGDAFGLDAGNISKLIGFRCHVCRERTPPICSSGSIMKSDGSPLAKALANEEVNALQLERETRYDEKSNSIHLGVSSPVVDGVMGPLLQEVNMEADSVVETKLCAEDDSSFIEKRKTCVSTSGAMEHLHQEVGLEADSVVETKLCAEDDSSPVIKKRKTCASPSGVTEPLYREVDFEMDYVVKTKLCAQDDSSPVIKQQKTCASPSCVMEHLHQGIDFETDSMVETKFWAQDDSSPVIKEQKTCVLPSGAMERLHEEVDWEADSVVDTKSCAEDDSSVIKEQKTCASSSGGS